MPNRSSHVVNGLDNREILCGRVERIVFHAEENGFTVMRVVVSGRRDAISIVGHSSGIRAGDDVRATGVWVDNPRFGSQFQAESLGVVPPTSRMGVEKYLASGVVKGIGPKHARRLVDAFGSAVFEIIENEPARLRRVPGIGPSLQARIVDAWSDKTAMRDTLVFLHQCGVGPARARQIYKAYGQEAVQLIRADPYRLVGDVGGIGFATADAMAIQMGILRTALTRVRAALHHVLGQAADKGHCGMPIDALRSDVVKLLDVSDSLADQAIAEEVGEKRIVIDVFEGHRCAYLAELYLAEKEIADRIKALAKGTPSWSPLDSAMAFKWLQKKLNLELADEQGAAVKLALESKILVITGGPGVGKTTLVNAVLTVLKARGVVIELAAPTGRAAKRLAETTGMEARTIHRLLAMDPKTGRFRRDENVPLKCDLLVIDEASMVDVKLMNAVLRALPCEVSLILVGDVDQLPSVGPGQVLADLISARTTAVARLTKVFRQRDVSRIIVNTHRINQGNMPTLDANSGDFYFVEVRDSDDGIEKIKEIVRERIPDRFGLDPMRDVQVISPMLRGTLGVRNLNLAIQRELNPGPGPCVERFGSRFGIGDKVMQTKNNYDWDVYNGDIGFISHADAQRTTVRVKFDAREQIYGPEELDQLVHAYAISIHKSQGSEYAAVVMALCNEHYPMLQRNLVYTGVTRGRNLVVIVGQRSALAMAVKGSRVINRWSNLRRWLKPDQC